MEQDLSNVKYVGPAPVKRLAEHGVTTVEQLAALPGIGDSTAPVETAGVDVLAEEIPAEYVVVVSEPELSKKEIKKAAKKAKKAVKKALKKAEKLEKETKKAARKAEKKAEKKEKKKKKD